ncbi:hypothetical protein J2T17_002612 [Paenibacillus mucilaginosus]|uniref:eCIS core domain-containing protein n=1 Tax=Paenibacillus mucilaginosus TaxID=61624 RepID=UPI003D244373
MPKHQPERAPGGKAGVISTHGSSSKVPGSSAPMLPAPLQRPAVPFTPEAILQLQKTIGNRAVTQLLRSSKDAAAAQAAPPVQKKNHTGIPDSLKSGLESLSGMDLSDVRVHYNSSQPAAVQAHAYAQGNEIHVAPGQERHLAHEGWHVVQQRQGRVKPTMLTEGGVPVNDDAGLEREADVMGERAGNHNNQINLRHYNRLKHTGGLFQTLQRVEDDDEKPSSDDFKKLFKVALNSIIKKRAIHFWNAERIKINKANYPHISNLWIELALEWFEQQVRLLHKQLRFDANLLDGVDLIGEEFPVVNHQLTKKEAREPSKNTIEFIEGFANYIPFVSSVIPERVSALTLDLTRYLTKATDCSVVTNNYENMYKQERSLLEINLVELKNQRAKQPELPFSIVMDTINQACSRAEEALIQYPEVFEIDNVIRQHSRDSKEIIENAVYNSFKVAQLRFTKSREEIKYAYTLVDPKFTEPIKNLKNSKVNNSMINIYGIKWLETIATITETEKIHNALTRLEIPDIVTALKKKVKPGVDASKLFEMFEILGSKDDNFEVLKQLTNAFNYISIPKNVSVTSWKNISNFLFPASFSMGHLETDELCMKHSEEEVGKDPSKEKLEKYFLELVEACEEARINWNNQNQPPTGDYYIKSYWHIIMKNIEGRPQVFHIDSGYKKSPWVKK